MDAKELISNLPQVLTLLVPGYLVISVSGYILPQPRGAERATLLQALIYSVLITQLAEFWLQPWNLRPARGLGFLLVTLASVLLGLVRGKLLRSEAYRSVLARLKIDSHPDASVWNEMLSRRPAQWARAYLDDKGLMYEGYVDRYSLDPEGPRELFLAEPRLYRLEKDGLVLVEDRSEVKGAGVLLSAALITRLELFP